MQQVPKGRIEETMTNRRRLICPSNPIYQATVLSGKRGRRLCRFERSPVDDINRQEIHVRSTFAVDPSQTGQASIENRTQTLGTGSSQPGLWISDHCVSRNAPGSVDRLHWLGERRIAVRQLDETKDVIYQSWERCCSSA